MIYKGNFEQLIKRLSQSLKNPKDLYFSYGIHDHDMITTGDEKDYNFLHLTGLPVYNIGRSGGTIVHSAGDISGIFMWKDHDFCHEFPEFLVKKLQEKGINAFNSNNDVLINKDNKVAGFACKELKDGRWYVTFQISININIPALMVACKPAQKYPSCLSNYGVSTEEVEKWLLEFLLKRYGETDATYLD